jgi:hypothetical protein
MESPAAMGIPGTNLSVSATGTPALAGSIESDVTVKLPIFAVGFALCAAAPPLAAPPLAARPPFAAAPALAGATTGFAALAGFAAPAPPLTAPPFAATPVRVADTPPLPPLVAEPGAVAAAGGGVAGADTSFGGDGTTYLDRHASKHHVITGL